MRGNRNLSDILREQKKDWKEDQPVPVKDIYPGAFVPATFYCRRLAGGIEERIWFATPSGAVAWLNNPENRVADTVHFFNQNGEDVGRARRGRNGKFPRLYVAPYHLRRS